MQKEHVIMSQFVSTLSACAIATALVIAFAATPAAAATDADKAALAQATTTCKARVKEQTQFQETSLYARHKMVKKCVQDALAHH
jgi:stress-induced morphogen